MPAFLWLSLGLATTPTDLVHTEPWPLYAVEQKTDRAGNDMAVRNTEAPVRVLHTVLAAHPEPTATASVDCVVAFAFATGRWVSHASGCGGAYLTATKAALSQWVLSPPDGLQDPELSFHLTYLVKDGTPATLVSLQPHQAPEEVGALPFVTIVQKVRPKRTVAPKYPEAARKRGLGEEVCLAALAISAKGKVETVNVSECDAAFHDAVHTALKGWRFHPHIVEGQAVPTTLTLPVRFRLHP